MADKVVVKVHNESNDVSSYRTFRFEGDCVVSEAVEQVKAKFSPEKAELKWGLYVCFEEKGHDGYWLDPTRRIDQYGLSLKDKIQLKLLNTMVVVEDLDRGSAKTLKMDLTETIEAMLPEVGRRFGIDDVSEFSLQVVLEEDRQLHWLNPKEPLYRQKVDEKHRLVFRKKFFVTDAFITPKDPYMLHMVYLEAHHAVIRNHYPTTFDQAVQLAALQMQITYGNYDPLLHVANFLKLDEFLPASARVMQFVEEDVYTEHRKCTDVDPFEAKFKYVKKCSKLPTFGATFCAARERLTSDKFDHDVLFGVNADAILSLHHQTKAEVGRNLLVEFTAERHGADVRLQFKSRIRELQFEREEDAWLMEGLIEGYKEFQRMRRKEKFIGQDLYLSGVTTPTRPSGGPILWHSTSNPMRTSTAVLHPTAPHE